MRNKVIIGNWKMHKTISEAREFIKEIDTFAYECQQAGIILGIAPSFLCLAPLQSVANYTLIAAQNVNDQPSGAFTGEISIPMLQEVGIQYSLVGHSERRNYYNETSLSCNKKNKALFNNGLFPIYCVGETLAQYEQHASQKVVEQQLNEGLQDLTGEQVSNLIIAYEPVWSIGTGKNASVEIAQSMCHCIRQTIASLYNQAVADQVIIQYGGSVKLENAKAYLSCLDIDGVLVGGASLQVETFKALVATILQEKK